jgi:hypothetical protein
MSISVFRASCLVLGLIAPATFTMRGSDRPSESRPAAALTAKVTLRDGTARSVKLDGIGCTVSICSRSAIRGQSDRGASIETRFDALASITNTSDKTALLTMKDGSRRRVDLLKDFRVLYLSRPSGVDEKLDLSKIQSIDFE